MVSGAAGASADRAAGDAPASRPAATASAAACRFIPGLRVTLFAVVMSAPFRLRWRSLGRRSGWGNSPITCVDGLSYASAIEGTMRALLVLVAVLLCAPARADLFTAQLAYQMADYELAFKDCRELAG